MVMWKAKSCPKCGGDTFLDIDEHIWFDHCLQCGYIRPKSDIECPQCGCDIVIDKYRGSKFYQCSHCGYTGELDYPDN